MPEPASNSSLSSLFLVFTLLSGSFLLSLEVKYGGIPLLPSLSVILALISLPTLIVGGILGIQQVRQPQNHEKN